MQLGFAQALQFHPKVCLTYLLLLEYCKQWLGGSTPSKGAKWSLASTEPVLTLWGSFHMLVPKLWALPAEVQTDAWILCCAMVRILEIVWARAENSAPLYTWDWGNLYKPDMDHTAFTLSDHRKLPTAFKFHIFPPQLHIFPDREGATACSLALVRTLVRTGSFMNAISSRSSLAHILVRALKYQHEMECLSRYQLMTQVFSNWIRGNLQSQ